MTIEDKVKKVMSFLEERGGLDVAMVDLEGRSSICDYFVIATFESPTVLKSTVRDIWEELAELSLVVNDRHKEVLLDGWHLIDCGDVVIHLFSPEMREFYSLEKLWKGYIQTAKEREE